MITTDQARADRRTTRRRRDDGPDERELRRLARTDMLNLHSDFAYWNPPEPDPRDLDVDSSPSSPSSSSPSGGEE